ncbi:hypothetical protein [Chitinibacter sp. S2-10]|uniref:hypothetical protein n=1 Tax=Chitinibacter sp. S2-10 TaxID=3373597 RepID=UPI003977670C
MKSVALVIIVACSLAIGFYVGATEYKDAFSGIKWTDVGTFLVTFFGVIFGFYTYFQWLNNKYKEDAYLAAKKYIASIDEIEEQLDELLFQYNHICPAAGLVVENIDISLGRIKHLDSVCNLLYQARRNLNKSHRELEFWNVFLTNEYTKKHLEINKALANISSISYTLNNQLFHFIKSGMENTSDVTQHKSRLDEECRLMHKYTQERIQKGFQVIFEFNK